MEKITKGEAIIADNSNKKGKAISPQMNSVSAVKEAIVLQNENHANQTPKIGKSKQLNEDEEQAMEEKQAAENMKTNDSDKEVNKAEMAEDYKFETPVKVNSSSV